MPRLTVLVLGSVLLALGQSLQFMDVEEMLEYAEQNVNKAVESWRHSVPQDLSSPEDRQITRKRAENQLLSDMNVLSFKLDDVESKLNRKIDSVGRIVQRLPERTRLFFRLEALSSYIESLDQAYSEMLRYVRKLVDADENELVAFAEKIIEPSSHSIQRNLYSVYTEFCRDVENCILYSLHDAMKESQTALCDTKQSPQQLMYNLYNSIALAEMKGYAMLQFSYNILRLHKKKNYTQEIKNSKNDYAQMVMETLKHVKIAMAYATKEMWRCDPHDHKEDVTFTELKEVFQGYIVNEVDLNLHKTCRENCAFYTNTKVEGCYASQYCGRQKRCNGKVVKCQFIDSDMWVCPAPAGSKKRYEYIEYENGKRLGRKHLGCSGQTKVDSWWRWLFWHCSYCFCYCDDHTAESDRYFNLRNVTSDIHQNKVIVGVRFRKVNHIVFIQIKEGLLLPKGDIDPESVKWKPLDTYSISQIGIRNGQDYHTIEWQKRAVDLDDLVPSKDQPVDELLTGLRFRVVGAHLNLEIRTTPFNFTTGKLMPDRSQWHSNDNTDRDGNASTHVKGRRTEVRLENRDVPTREEYAKSQPDSSSNQFLYFQPTDLEMDVAQSTIPFLDIQPVEVDPPAPVTGAGIFHKSRGRSGGFLALKLITYDFAKHLNADLPFTPMTVVGLSNEINSV